MEPLSSRATNIIKKYGVYLSLSWTVIVIISLGLNIYVQHQDTIKKAVIQARTYCELNAFYRIVVSHMGGIYAPINAIAPNPYLPLLDRDVTTTDGKKLTLVNPAYMTRLVFDAIKEKTMLPVLNKITSLKSLNPINSPDAWEKEMLLAFESGRGEAVEVTNISGEPYLRLMKPFITEDSCLKCHGHQGYKQGDIRGGISIAIPLQPYYETESRTRNIIIKTHLLLWFIGSGILVLFTRITIKNARAHEETKILSLHDPLTKLANRRLMEIEFEKSFARTKRYGNELSVIMLDIDHFKEYNDVFGHKAGDELLTRIAHIVSEAIRDTDLAIRYGGEEFLILLPQTGESETFEVAERIRGTVEAETEITVSLGISVYNPNMQKKEEIINKADEALYRAKQKGRNRTDIQ